MPQVIFKIDKEKDMYNLWELCNIDNPYVENPEKKQLNSDYKQLWDQKNFKECKREIEKDIQPLYSSGILNIFKDELEKAWEKVNNIYFSRLEKVIKKPIYPDKFTGYITTVGRCPYNPQDYSFMISIKRPLLQCLRTIGHELLHIQFHNSKHWETCEKEIGKEKTNDLKEALTVLLNLEFKDLWFVEDRGYDSHKELRNFITNEWKKEKDFERLIDKCVEYLKK
ncbi:hypothetical protein M0R19_02725 [Candidatus Pacearchaeota archaeon]|jgi:hypothetical protein|nr:hypothetical protein [Candidatus Pacearchaeota archaeon]